MLKILGAVFLALAAQPVLAQENSACYECHADEEFVTVDDTGKEKSLYVSDSLYSETAHGDLLCVDCHSDLDESAAEGHDSPLTAVDCSLCHEDIQQVYDNSIHGQLLGMGDKEVATCVTCHGTHNIFPPSDDRSTVNKFNLVYTCAQCHEKVDLVAQRKFPQADAVPQFLESVHAKGLMRDGLIVAPSCNDCHGTHDIQVSSNPASPIYRRNVYKTCGKCHTKIESVYTQSIHGQLVEKGDKRGPVCNDCHESHLIINPEMTTYKQYSDQKCGQCHSEMLARYNETFHGKAMELGATNVAACYDCHGNHDVYRTDDPRSLISPENKVETCRKCHEGATKNFAAYITHADHFDREKYPELFYSFLFMTLLLVGVFLFFGLHTLLWVVRSVALFLRDSKAFKEAKLEVSKADLLYVRFTPLERFLHVMLIVSFIALVLSGIPLKFYYAGWAQVLMKFIGGVENAGYLHRTAAFTLVFVFVIHVAALLRNFLPKLRTFKSPETGKFSFQAFLHYLVRPDSLVPNKRDFVDFWNHQKWFFGKGEKPKFERWTYWEKFDYFAVFWGIVIIGGSGLVLWFPGFFTTFLPGWIINVALIVHSDEALLAAGFIFTFHFFNVHFRIEKYPMDTVIFSGRISKQEFRMERPGWLERLSRENKLDTLKEKDEWESWKPIAKTFGFIAFGTGLLLAGAIFTAMIIRMLL